jgi:hypothetical protein
LEIVLGGVVMADAPKLDPIAVARAAGLDEVAKRYPDDILAAAAAMAQDLANFPAIEGVPEPWPSMRIRGDR